MKPSDIGGQALIEGIMMRHGEEYSVAVRRPDQEIEVKTEPYKSILPYRSVQRIPILRGVISFIDSMVVGISTLMYSASFYEDEEDGEASVTERAGSEAVNPNAGLERAADAAETESVRINDGGSSAKRQASRMKADAAREERREKVLMYGVFAISFVAAILIFMLLPYYLSTLLARVITSHWLLSLAEAVLRVVIFLGYLALVSRMKDIQRTFMYHGAEHKCINCVEHGMPLTVENVLQSSRFHKRCGTSFLFIVVIISAVLLMFIRTDSRILRVVYRLLLIPVIAGISYELLRFAGRHDNPVVNLLSKPGLALQRLTTREPDAPMAEVAIAAVEAVFDWKNYLRENFGYDTGADE